MNRTFSFENSFLEVAWVHNEQEIKSDLVKPTGLGKEQNTSKTIILHLGSLLQTTRNLTICLRMPIGINPNISKAEWPLIFYRIPFNPSYRGLAECLSEKRTRKELK